MNNLIILLSVLAIMWVIGYCVYSLAKQHGFKRKVLFLRFGVTFFVCGMFWTPLVSYYNFKHQDKHIWNLIQMHFTLRPIMVWAKSIDAKVTKATDPFVPKVLGNTIGPVQRQTANVFNQVLPGREVPAAKGGLWQKVGGVVGVVGNTVKGIIGIIL